VQGDCAFDTMDSKAGAPMNGRPNHGGARATLPRLGMSEMNTGAVVVEA
jgi:hypothetical protein